MDSRDRRNAPSPASSSAGPLLDPALLRRLLRARDRMDAASHEAWPVERLAAVVGVTQAHFARSFKRAFGIPPHRYLLTRRIERAVGLLRDTGMSITEIAYATGWESLGTFGRVFRDEAQADRHRLRPIPACVLKAALRPDLGTAVLEKRRREAGATLGPSTQEVS
jgi:transcriptional regulator GlxA family with amidase domain